MDRFYLLAPPLLLLATLSIAFVIYCGMCAMGRTPKLRGVKHNQFFGPFMGRFLVWVLQPIERLLIGRVSPNAITALSLLMCAITGVAAGVGNLGATVWLYAFAGFLDVLDGRLARQSGRQTAAGALFDSVSDRWGELFVFAGYCWHLHDSAWMLAGLLAAGGSMMVSYTRARAEGLGIELSGGVMQRAERIVLMAVGTLLAAWYAANPETAAAATPILGGTLLLCGAASGATAVNRWILAFRQLAKRSPIVEPEAEEAEPVAAEPEPIFAPVPAKLRESAELGL